MLVPYKESNIVSSSLMCTLRYTVAQFTQVTNDESVLVFNISNISDKASAFVLNVGAHVA